jgi:hypothetical protein
MKQFIIIFLCLFFSTNAYMKRAILFLFLLVMITSEVFAQDGDQIGLIGFGESTGEYTEAEYQLRNGVEGESYLYENYYLKTGSSLASRSNFWMYTSFELETKDFRDHTHKLRMDLVGKHWAKGVKLDIKYGENNFVVVDGSLFFGVGAASGEKSITHLNGNQYASFPRTLALDLSWGFKAGIYFIFDKTYTLSFTTIFQNNTIEMIYNDNNGYLTFRKTGLITIGRYLKPQQNCKETLYVSCP